MSKNPPDMRCKKNESLYDTLIKNGIGVDEKADLPTNRIRKTFLGGSVILSNGSFTDTNKMVYPCCQWERLCGMERHKGK